MLIVKDGGCDHMTCLCEQQFCYRCGGIRCFCHLIEEYDDCVVPHYEWPQVYNDDFEEHLDDEDDYYYSMIGRYFIDFEVCKDCQSDCHFRCLDRKMKQEEESLESSELQTDLVKQTFGGKSTRLWKGTAHTSARDAEEKYRKSNLAKKQRKRLRRLNRKICTEKET